MSGLIEIKFDGACRNIVGKSSTMGIGVAVFFDGDYMEEESEAIQVNPVAVRGTSNVSEWEACCEGWKKAKELNEKYPGNRIKIFSDSDLITNQFNGDFAINNESFKFYYNLAQSIQKEVGAGMKIEWISRNFNKEADKLSKLGLQGKGQIRNEIEGSIPFTIQIK